MQNEQFTRTTKNWRHLKAEHLLLFGVTSSSEHLALFWGDTLIGSERKPTCTHTHTFTQKKNRETKNMKSQFVVVIVDINLDLLVLNTL